MFKIKKLYQESMDMNTYLLIKQDVVSIVDPGLNGIAIKEFVEGHQFKMDSILLTHGHFDHIFSIEMLKEYQPFTIYIHELDYPMLYDTELNYASAFGRTFNLDKHFTVKKIVDGQTLDIQGENISVIHTPGHTFGSVMFKYQANVFSGDTLFYDSVGRTDLFSGNFNALRRSINMIKDRLSNQLMIYPGHGRSGKLKDIKKVNRFLQ